MHRPRWLVRINEITMEAAKPWPLYLSATSASFTGAPSLSTAFCPRIAQHSSTQAPYNLQPYTKQHHWLPAFASYLKQSKHNTCDHSALPTSHSARFSHHLQRHDLTMKASQILSFVFLATSSVVASALPESNALDLLEAHGASVPRSEILSPEHALEKRKGGGGKGGGGSGGSKFDHCTSSQNSHTDIISRWRKIGWRINWRRHRPRLNQLERRRRNKTRLGSFSQLWWWLLRRRSLYPILGWQQDTQRPDRRPTSARRSSPPYLPRTLALQRVPIPLHQPIPLLQPILYKQNAEEGRPKRDVACYLLVPGVQRLWVR
jgi:phage baseplate assembly protein gpV